MFVSCDGSACPDFKGFTLLMPAVSVGNVGQLAVDLVISTVDMSKVGYFYTDCLVPMVGNNPYATTEENATELCINAEVYAAPSKQLAVLQIRSLFIKNKYRSFCQTLLSWVKSCSFAQIVLLSSSHAYQRNDQQLHGTSLRYLLSSAVEKAVGDQMQRLNRRELEQTATFPGVTDEKVFHIPGGGITKLLFNESCSKGIPMIVFLKFCSEGDNIPDALTLADYLNEWLQLTANQGKVSQPTVNKVAYAKSVTLPESNRACISIAEDKTEGEMPKNKQELKTVAVDVWQSITRDETQTSGDVYAFQTSVCKGFAEY